MTSVMRSQPLASCTLNVREDIEDRAGPNRCLKEKACCAAQIHDELLLEVDRNALAQASALVRECMEGAASLRVPLRVKLSAGPSWGQLEPYG